MKSTVLITGASGFIGRQAASALLQKGFQVHGLSRFQRGSESGIIWHTGDLFDSASIRRVLERARFTHLLHLAWETDPSRYRHAKENGLWFDASRDLIEQFTKGEGRRIVVAGSCSEYEPGHEVCSELFTPVRPNTFYGICKNRLREWLERDMGIGKLNFAWARIFFLYGPYEKRDRLVPSVILSLLQDQPALCTSGDQIVDMLHVQDAGDVLSELLVSRVIGPVNIASGTALSVREIVTLIARMVGKEPLLRVGALQKSSMEQGRVADVSRLLQNLKWRPRYNLRTGLESTIAWWKAILETNIVTINRF